jgi:diadenylate cyclase
MVHQLFIDLSFIKIRIWDILDILIVGYLIFQIYRLLKGSIAFNIFIGLLIIFVVWWLVKAMHMDLLSMILGQFVNVGVIVIAIIFQQEIRKFLLYLGSVTLQGRKSFFSNINEFSLQNTDNKSLQIKALKEAIIELSEKSTGALIVLANNLALNQFGFQGVVLDSEINKPIIMSIFQKESPLHDGAIIIANYKIHEASAVLPITENSELGKGMGMRHRAALGITETTNVVAFVVSEENGKISFANRGTLLNDIDAELLNHLLIEHFN